MTAYRWRRDALAADYARSAAGLVLCGGLGLLAAPGSAIMGGLLAAAALFAAYGARTALRQATRVELDGQGLRLAGPVRRELDWAALEGMGLGYYSTRRDGEQGWMRLKVHAGGGWIALDSGIDGFFDIVQAAAGAAARRGLALDLSTLENLAALGIDIGTAGDRDAGR